jgi:glutathione synthase
MKILFIADPLNVFKTYKDTTYAMMREMAHRDWKLYHTLANQMSIEAGIVVAKSSEFSFIGTQSAGEHQWYKLNSTQSLPLNSFDAVIMRTDPPFNMQYLYATQLLTLAEKQGARVFNSGQAMRDFNEKLAIFHFPALIPSTIVTTRATEVHAFLDKHRDIIIKPLDGMGGMGIFRLSRQDPNISSILEMLMQMDNRTIMAQQYIPEITLGDKRILVINGKVVPYALARIPKNGETRGNLAAGGKGVVQLLTKRDLYIAEAIAPELVKRGILLAGLDVIGDYLTEINVTSPTGFQEISLQTDCNVAAIFADAIVSALH